MRSPFVYLPGDRLSEAELRAACLDGDLIELGEGFMPADAVVTPSLRAASLDPVVGERYALALMSAAWVYGAALETPAPHSVTTLPGYRASFSPADRGLDVHEFRLSPDDISVLAGVPLTSPTRTLIDLARRAADDQAGGVNRGARPRGPDEHERIPAVREAISALLEAQITDLAAAQRWAAAHPRTPGVRRALGILRGA